MTRELQPAGVLAFLFATLWIGAPSAQGTEAPERFVLRGGRVMTAAGTIHARGDVLVAGDRIEAVGVDLAVPANTRIVDVTGRTLTPGLIDSHSHIGVYPAPYFKAHSDGNEAVAAVCAPSILRVSVPP